MAEKKCGTCDDAQCSAKQKRAQEDEKDFIERQILQSRMCKITHKIIVLSGKGGVGKSTVAVNLAVALALAGKKVGLLDVDIHGPSVPKLLKLENTPVSGTENTLYPIEVSYASGKISVMSIGFLLRQKDSAVIWRGPMKYNVIKQFLRDVQWGDLDYLVVDSPPGTGDEPLAVVQLIEKASGAVVVTTPQDVATQDVRRSIVFCHQLDLPVLGVIENMSGFVCPKCGENIGIFGSGGGKIMAEQMGVGFLGSIPIEPEVVVSGDKGTPIVQARPESQTAKVFNQIVNILIERGLNSAKH